MDLSVLHPVKSPDHNYTWKNRLNSITSSLGCRFLEWTGWYNQDIPQRLLGHYRLYQLFKAKSRVNTQIPFPLCYIAYSQPLHPLKYIFSCLVGALYYLATFGGRYYPLQVEGVNKLLLGNRNYILQEFLTHAEINFEDALVNAINQLNESHRPVNQANVFIQNRNEYNTYHNSSHYFTEYYSTLHPGAVGIKGKEKGVFSKKQILIFFHFLAEIGIMERIDFSKPNKFEAVAEMLQAITGKGKDTWIEELKNYKNRGLYEYQNEGELRQLIITLTNLSEVFKKASMRTIAKACDEKLRKFETEKRNFI